MLRAPFQPECVTSNREPGSTFLKNNFDLCRAVDMLSLGTVLERMTEQGWIDADLAKAFLAQARALLTVLRAENGRGHEAALKAKDPRHD